MVARPSMHYVYLIRSLTEPSERYVGLCTDLNQGSGHAFAKKRFW
jgi:hypothetical protein